MSASIVFFAGAGFRIVLTAKNTIIYYQISLLDITNILKIEQCPHKHAQNKNVPPNRLAIFRAASVTWG